MILSEIGVNAMNNGIWIKPVYEGNEPSWEPRPLFWYQVEGNPVVYRTEIKIEQKVKMTPIIINTYGYCYVFVDDQEVYGKKEEKNDKKTQIYATDLANFLSIGNHVLWISAPRDGFAMSGFIQYEDGTRKPINTDKSWKVKKFPSSTILELQEDILNDWNGTTPDGWVDVEEVSEQALIPDKFLLLSAYYTTELDRLQETISEISWKYELLKQKGLVIEDWQSYGWGKATRISAIIQDAINNVINEISPIQNALDELKRKQIHSINDFNMAISQLEQTRSKIKSLSNALSAFTNYVMAFDRAKFFALLKDDQLSNYGKSILKDLDNKLDYKLSGWENIAESLSDINNNLIKMRSEYEKSIGHPINELNQSRYNKFGWIPVSELVDSEINDWGIRVSIPQVEWSIDAPKKWWLMLDPNNQGLSEKRESYGYNIEDQWPKVEIGRSWESQKYNQENPNFPSDKPYKSNSLDDPQPYDGYAWYRTRMLIPEEWRGYDLELVADKVDDWDWAYFNGEFIGKTGDEVYEWWRQPRRYKVPSSIIKYGEENVIAWRIYDAGGEGMLGNVRVECPSLRGISYRGTKADVLSTPLFPGAVITPKEKTLTIWGWRERQSPGPESLIMMLDGNVIEIPIKDGNIWTKSAGRLSENWILLWTRKSDQSLDLPILLVCEKIPLAVTAFKDKDGVTQIDVDFSEPNVRVVALRPFQTTTDMTIEKAADVALLWGRIAMFVPINYAEITRYDETEKRIHQTIIYDYLEIKDGLDTHRKKIAPLPPLLSRAIDKNYPDIKIDDSSEIQTLIDKLGDWSAYRALDGDCISYSYAVDPFPRLGGFTSWMFAPSDTGVPGNERECELIALTGSNSFRPQHNYTGERVDRLLADCRKYGLTYTTNVDQTLGMNRDDFIKKIEEKGYDEAFQPFIDHYLILVEQLKNEPQYGVVYDLINEAFDHPHEKYNPAIKRMINAIREKDKEHLIYVEPMETWGALETIHLVEPTGDPLTLQSFHDYNFRLRGDDRWPTINRDFSTMYERFLPAIKYMIDHGTVMHCGEFGGFETFNNPCIYSMLGDFLRIFDQFGMHFHYYANRMTVRSRADGSLEESLVNIMFRKYFKAGYFNLYYPKGNGLKQEIQSNP
jgi:hypothetical protein